MAGMVYSRIISDLDTHLTMDKKEKEALLSLLATGKISQYTFDLMEKRMNRVIAIISDLKEALTKEEVFWNETLSEKTRILESFLIELEFKRLLGELGEEEWTRRSLTVILGLESLRNSITSTSIVKQRPALTPQITVEETHTDPVETSKAHHPISDLDKQEGLPDRASPDLETDIGSKEEPSDLASEIKKEPPDIDSLSSLGVQCMNPWNPDCESRDIELSIYYDGRMVPICRICWEGISKNNIEW